MKKISILLLLINFILLINYDVLRQTTNLDRRQRRIQESTILPDKKDFMWNDGNDGK